MKVGIDARLLSLPVTGIGRYTLEMCRELVRLGGQYYLYSPAPLVQGVWDLPNVTVRSADFTGRVGRMLWSQSLLPYWAVRDQVDVFWGTTHRLPRLLSSSISRVVTIHDLVWKHAGDTMRPLSRFMEARLMPDAIRLADRIVADSFCTVEALEAEYPRARGITQVVYLGACDLPSPEDRSVLGRFGVNRPYFLFVGTLEPRKNLSGLLQAYARLAEPVRKAAMLVIAGGKGWGSLNLEGLIEQLGLKDDVRMTGYVSEQDLATLYAHARFVAMPSVYEGFGLPVLEAKSFGVPSLISQGTSIVEIAGDSGLPIDPLDESSIMAGLLTMITDDDVYARLRKNTQNNLSMFSWKKAAAEVHRILNEAIQERKSRH